MRQPAIPVVFNPGMRVGRASSQDAAMRRAVDARHWARIKLKSVIHPVLAKTSKASPCHGMFRGSRCRTQEVELGLPVIGASMNQEESRVIHHLLQHAPLSLFVLWLQAMEAIRLPTDA